eukprot:TRINITY_DN5233_c0_g2_i1.p1 TRINITY_DN5233_c0_g2~~TRINITY_DN5233_c0_g2_i1.p1  ORF type:complete len:344 (+),score=36.09 TRINITY_DN5233_c0_g2_i1:157-1188(+)
MHQPNRTANDLLAGADSPRQAPDGLAAGCSPPAYRAADDLPGNRSCDTNGGTLSGKYYYHTHGFRQPPQEAEQAWEIDTTVLGGHFELGELLGTGHHGRVYRLNNMFPIEYQYVLKASADYVDRPPYFLRKSIGNGRFLYILLMASAESFAVRFDGAVANLWSLHNNEKRAHGDVSPQNLFLAWRNSETHALISQFSQLVDELGWQVVSRNRDASLAQLIDPDIGGTFGDQKAVSHTLHEDPRCDRWSRLDDLIGLLNTMLLEMHITVERVGGFLYGPQGDFCYGCDQASAKLAWCCIIDSYNEADPVQRIGLVFEQLSAADRSQTCLMSSMLTSAAIKDGNK